jgi:hypothetical protein
MESDVMRTDSEPELAVGMRLFWATIIAVILVIGLPILIGHVLSSTPHAARETVAPPEVLAGRRSMPVAVSSQELPKGPGAPIGIAAKQFWPSVVEVAGTSAAAFPLLPS